MNGPKEEPGGSRWIAPVVGAMLALLVWSLRQSAVTSPWPSSTPCIPFVYTPQYPAYTYREPCGVIRKADFSQMATEVQRLEQIVAELERRCAR